MSGSVKAAVVTGAAGGIGAEICKRLNAMGYAVLAVDLSAEALNGVCEMAPSLSALALDLAAPDAAQRILNAVQVRFGRCDLLVNNAGTVVTTPFEAADPEHLRRELNVNLTAPLLLTRALYPLLQADRGQVISVVSLGSMLPLGESPGYNAGKFGLRGLMLGLALRTPETGVRISTINPAAVDTAMLRYEAQTGGSPMNFVGSPMPAARVADAVVRQLRQPCVETDLSAADGWLIRIAMLVPNLFPRLLPLFMAIGRRGRERYLREKGLSPMPPDALGPG